MNPSGQARLIAREGALAAITGHLAGLDEGRARLVLVSGEPGIGKSRLLESVTQNSPWETLRATGDELSVKRPFGVLLDAFACRPNSPDPVRASIARSVTRGTSEYQVIDDLLELIEALAITSPILCVLDDLQWADSSSLLTLRHLFRHLLDVPIGVVAATRTVPERPDIDALAEAGEARRIGLGPLPPDAVKELVSATLGREPSPTITALTARAGGNPFYILELVAAIAESGPEATDSSALPSVFQLTVRRYLRFLSPLSLQLLRMAAMLGGTFSATDLVLATGADIRDVLPVLDEAIRAGILVDADDRLTFRHDLLRQALYDDIPGSARETLHLAVARTLAAGGAQPVLIAEHLLAAGRPVSGEDVSLLLDATRQVVNAKDRAELLIRVLALVPGSDPKRAEVAGSAIEALSLAGRGDEADALAQRELHPDEGSIRVAWLRSLANRTLAAQFLEQLAHIEGLSLPPGLEGELAGLESGQRMLIGDVAGAATAAERALSGTHSSPLGVVFGLQTQSMIAMAEGKARDCVRLASESVNKSVLICLRHPTAFSLWRS